jgi:CRP-like cAMP-binding protein
MKDTITNFTMPDPRHRVRITVGAHYRHPPNAVKAAMLRAATQCPEVINNPAPSVFLEDFGDSSINYRLNAWITAYGSLERIKDDIRTHIWYEFEREGIEIPFPIRTLYRPRQEADFQAEREAQVARLVPILQKIDLLAGLSAEALAELAGRARVSTHGAGEVLFRENEPGHSVYILLSGRANVIKTLESGAQQRLASLEPGHCFGEMSLLLGEPRNATVQVQEDSEVVEMDSALFKSLIETYPAVLEHVTALVESRRNDNEKLRDMFARQQNATQQTRLSMVMNQIKKALGL